MARRYILGILMLMAYLQPLVVNALVFNINEKTPSNTNNSHITNNPPAKHAFLVESVLLDIDDDDDLLVSEKKNTESDLYKNTIFLHSSFTINKARVHFIEYPHKYPVSKPLYILWRVFRI